jgi:DNA-binding transcriptional LysR family regulator
MSDRLSALRLFVRVARTASFSRAGRELGLSQPSVSRIIADLECQVGANFFTRNTRAVTLTEKGIEYLARVQLVLAALDEADHAARGDGELRGVVRVALSSSFGVREVIPRLPTFMNLHPELKIDLSIDDRLQDLVVGGIDIALRFGRLTDSTAVARRLGTSPRLLVASPSYLQRGKPLKSHADLEGHSLIAGPGGIRAGSWSFMQDGSVRSIRVAGRLTASSHEAAIAAAVAGLGIACTSAWGCRAELENGSLIRVLSHCLHDRIELNAVFPAGRAATVGARAFADYLASALRDCGQPVAIPALCYDLEPAA